jgi:hypothetical protein
MKKTVFFEKDRDTKNTVVFVEKPEPGTPPVIGTIYLQKWFIADSERVTVTVEFGETGTGPVQI